MALLSIPAWSAIFRPATFIKLFLATYLWLACGALSLLAQQPWVPPPSAAPGIVWKDNQFVVLCYHDIRLPEDLRDPEDVDIFSLVKQLEYMRDSGCHFISVQDIIDASQGKKKLPPKAILMTFDDAYESFYKTVFPLLKIYRCPSVLAVISNWIDTPPKDPAIEKHKFMNWSQLREVAQSGMVEIASHSHDFHRAVMSNPQGNTAHAMVTREFYPKTSKYENEAELRRKLFADLSESRRIITEKTGIAPRVVVWPYGRYNEVCLEEAFRAGFKMSFSLDDGIAQTSKIRSIPRYMLQGNPTIDKFVLRLKRGFIPLPQRLRIIQADLDLICDPNPVTQEKNLDAFIERIYRIKPSAVFLEAFCDTAGNGNIASVYFPNRVLPMKADLFNRVCRALSIRGIQVYAWMPTLCVQLPDPAENARLRIKQFQNGKITDSQAWYQNRLSPFAPEAVAKLAMLYSDLAANAPIDGIIFQDDGYLNDFEDFSPEALKQYLAISGGKLIPFAQLTPPQKQAWTALKTAKLTELTERLRKSVSYYRPDCRFARTIYANVVTDPNSEEWFAQSYKQCLLNYDYTVIMAYPRMDKISNPEKWLTRLVEIAKQHPDGIRKTVFKVQTYDWYRKEWIASGTVMEWLKTLTSAGAWNLAYYPDDYTVNQPQADAVYPMMSVRDYPEIEELKKGLYY